MNLDGIRVRKQTNEQDTMKDTFWEKSNMDWVLDDTNELFISLGIIKAITEKTGHIVLKMVSFF